MENIVNHVGMNLDTRVIESAKWRGSQITDAGCGGTNEDNLSRKRTGRRFLADVVEHKAPAGAFSGKIVRCRLRWHQRGQSFQKTHRQALCVRRRRPSNSADRYSWGRD